MSNEQIYEMISAYAAGCMDDENFLHFTEYLESDGELPESELGELQNVIALMPVILDEEEPDPKLKGKLAKNLISLQEEIKEKIKAEKALKGKPRLKNLEGDKKNKSAAIDDKPDENKNAKTKIKREEIQKVVEDKSERLNSAGQNKRLVDELEKQSNAIETVDTEKPQMKISKLNLILIGIILVISLFNLFQFLSLNSYVGTTKDELYKEISGLKNRTANTELFIREHSVLIDFFSQGNLNLVNLKGTSNSPDASAKFLFSLEKSEGLLYAYNLPALNEGEVFKLWMVSRGRSYAITSFKTPKPENYIKIKNLPYIMADEIEVFRVTIETDLSSDIPEGKILLFGSFKK